MGEVKHTSSFLRTSLVKDPYCLGDFLEAKDVLRIESEFPEFFKSNKRAVEPGVKIHPSLQYTTPASGSPYKIPVIPKSYRLPQHPSSTTQNSLPFARNSQRVDLNAGSRRSYPQIRIDTRKLPLPATTQFKTSKISLASKNPPSHALLTQRSSTTTKLSTTSAMTAKTEVPNAHIAQNQQPSILGRRVSASPIQIRQRSLAKVKTPVAAVIGKPESTAAVSVINSNENHLRAARPCSFQSPKPKYCISEKRGSPSLGLLSGLRKMDPLVTKKKPATPTGFIRPIFSKKINKQKSQSQPEVLGESGDHEGWICNRGQCAKYEEILEKEDEDEQLEILMSPAGNTTRSVTLQEHTKEEEESAVKSFSTAEGPLFASGASLSPCSSKTELQEQEQQDQCKDSWLSRSEQVLLAELLTFEYMESGKFEKLILSEVPTPVKDFDETGLDSSETDESESDEDILNQVDPDPTPFLRVTQRQKIMLAKLAKELIQKEIRTCMSRPKEPGDEEVVSTHVEIRPLSKNEMLQFYKEGIKEMIDIGIGTDDVPPISKNEMFQFYNEGIKEMIDVGVGTDDSTPIQEYSLDEFLSSSTSSAEATDFSVKTRAVVLDVDTRMDEPITNGKMACHEQRIPLAVEEGIYASAPSTTASVTKGDEHEEEVQDQFNRSGFKKLPLEYPSFDETMNQQQDDVLEESNTENDAMSLEDSPSNILKDFARLSTILEEAVNSGIWETTPTGASKCPSQSQEPVPEITTKNETRNEAISLKTSSVPPQKPIVVKKNTETDNDTNNDITDCSSISDFILSEIKSPPKPVDTSTNNLPSKPEHSSSLFIITAEPPMSLVSKIETFLASIPRLDPLPEGLLNQSISLLNVSLPEAERTEISGSISSAPVSNPGSISFDSLSPATEDESICENDISVSRTSYHHLLSHGEFMLNQEKSTGEVSWPLVHSPGLCLSLGEGDSQEIIAAGTETE